MEGEKKGGALNQCFIASYQAQVQKKTKKGCFPLKEKGIQKNTPQREREGSNQRTKGVAVASRKKRGAQWLRRTGKGKKKGAHYNV